VAYKKGETYLHDRFLTGVYLPATKDNLATVFDAKKNLHN